MYQIDNNDNSSAWDLKAAVSSIIMQVITGWDGDDAQLRAVKYSLYLFEDAFIAMSKFKPGIS